MFCYDYPRPAVTTDVIVMAHRNERWQVLLIERGNEPFKAMWSLPGGFLDESEDLLTCAERELAEETGLTGLALEQFRAFGRPGRDPRGHTVTITYLAVAEPHQCQARAASDAAAVRWFALDELPPLAFDHDEIIDLAHRQLLARCR